VLNCHLLVKGMECELVLPGFGRGTACAIWTGIGAAGTFFVGVMFYGDPSFLMRYLGVLLIVAGVIALKLTQ